MTTPAQSATRSQAGAGKIRVLIVDDSAFMRRALRTMLESDPGIEVVDVARDGREGVEKAIALKPDVITLDIEMPNLDGMTALREIRVKCRNPRPAVLMCSSLTSAGSHEALKAMRLGAADVIAKDPQVVGRGAKDFRDELVAKVQAVAAGERRRSGTGAALRTSVASALAGGRAAHEHAQVPVSPPPALRPSEVDLVVIGSSTGGPPVLEVVLSALPADLCCPVVVAQHMPAMFTRSLAQRLDHQCAVSVVLGEEGMPLLPGTVYIAEGGRHTRVRRFSTRVSTGRMTLEVSPEPLTALYKPSVNELFRSAGEACGARAIGVMLTGMGEDGVVGSRTLAGAGGRILAQHERTCVVYGMPRAVVEAGLATSVLEPEGIAAALRRLSLGGASGTGGVGGAGTGGMGGVGVGGAGGGGGASRTTGGGSLSIAAHGRAA